MLLWYIHLAQAVESTKFLSTLPILFLAILGLVWIREQFYFLVAPKNLQSIWWLVLYLILFFFFTTYLNSLFILKVIAIGTEWWSHSYSSLYLLIPYPYIAPHPLPTSNHWFVLCTYESAPFFVIFTSLLYFLYSTYKWYHTVFLFLCLIYFT